MKAKEYAQRIIDDNYSIEVIFQVIKDLHAEIYELVTSRHCQTESAVNSVFKEIDQKYRAICTIVNKDSNIMVTNGFQLILQKNYAGTKVLSQLEYLKEGSTHEQ